MRKHHVALAVLTTLGLGASVATAGEHTAFGFLMGGSDGYRWANGTFGAARSDADATASAECATNATFGYCWFVKAGVSSYCYSTDPATLDVMRNMHDGAYFSVQWPEATAECSYVLQMTSSRTAPKAP
jgi:hypothetical protein